VSGLTGMSFGDVFVVSVELMRTKAAPGCVRQLARRVAVDKVS